MSEAPRIFPGGTVGGMEIRPLTGAQRETLDLIELGDAGFKIFRPGDFIEDYAPWLVARADGSIWTLEGGMPLSGYRPTTNALLVGKANSWAYLTAVSASSIGNPPRDLAELERRAAKAAEDAKRQRAAQEQRLRELRKQATPVTVGWLDSTLRMTLAEAAEWVNAAGGRIELRKGDDALVVSLPPSEMGWGGAPVHAAELLYRARGEVVACLRDKRPFPDVEVLPSGALAQ
jgi:hypothetical protein